MLDDAVRRLRETPPPGSVVHAFDIPRTYRSAVVFETYFERALRHRVQHPTLAVLRHDGNDLQQCERASSLPVGQLQLWWDDKGAAFRSSSPCGEVGGHLSEAACGQTIGPLLDVTGDSRADLVQYSRPRNAMWVLQSRGSGHFDGSPLKVRSGTEPGRLLIADFDGDGRGEIAEYHQDSGDLVVRGTATAPATPRARPAVHVGTEAPGVDVVAADFTGDGRADLLARPRHGPASVTNRNCRPRRRDPFS